MTMNIKFVKQLKCVKEASNFIVSNISRCIYIAFKPMTKSNKGCTSENVK